MTSLRLRLPAGAETAAGAAEEAGQRSRRWVRGGRGLSGECDQREWPLLTWCVRTDRGLHTLVRAACVQPVRTNVSARGSRL